MRLRGNAETDKMGNYFPTWAGRNSRRPTSASAPASPREADVVAAHHTTEEYARSCHAGSRSRAPAMSAARIRSFGCWCRMGAVYEVEMPRGIFAREFDWSTSLLGASITFESFDFVGLNTALLSHRDADEGHLAIDEEHLNISLVEASKRKSVVVAIGH